MIVCGKKRDLRLVDVTPDKMDKWGLGNCSSDHSGEGDAD